MTEKDKDLNPSNFIQEAVWQKLAAIKLIKCRGET
jgi:hypothetical protein